MIQVNELSLWFEGHEQAVISKLSFHLNAGETMLLLGPSGSGKSTLTCCLNGIYPRELDGKTEGKVRIFDKNVQATKPGEISKHVGVVFQDPESQFCMLTVEDEIAFGLENINTPREKIAAKIDEALQLVHLTEHREATIHSLSGGQKQKLALSCVLALEPDFVILDEPTANLDPLAKQEFIQTMKTIQQEKKIGLIVIEHQLEGWVTFIQRACILSRQGQCIFDGSLTEAITKHAPLLQSQGIALPPITELVLNAAANKQATFTSIPLTYDDFSAHVSYLDQQYLDKPPARNQNTKAALEAHHLNLTKNKRQILQHITCTLERPSFIAITGANGSGKTTLTRLLAGIETPSTGEIYVNHRLLKHWKQKELRQQIGYVFQNPEHQFITDSVFEEIAYTLRLRTYPETTIKEKVFHTLESCQLQGMELRHPYTLSQGQKRRLSVATMIVDEQNILFLDEPTFGQDAASTRELMRLLEERYKNGTTIIMVTHDMDIVDQYADRVIVLENGQIVIDETPEQLWERPCLNKWHLDYPTRIKLKRHLEGYHVYIAK
ncbi:putative HMP/thiamine import ATP-binding protein YkoD [Virgibacillus pantothenticus]|uniref:ABC transporter ATP-binding protein n=1 Tax=Virgibacillus TaxID=84406 RepID=UPI00090C79B1|nr:MULTISPECIES: ABC transporter ATP-binding protein [Virgibacillus]API92641.1 hypothetical protein BKP57_13005 [Virgibacillus sp. 6R]MBS7428131.1 ABC transporter ATP-binding protein [Virgibacillus sp. 19R1-5]GIP63281.1 putative HMP/thiamine import ATP-binding protein YkoD [Virgibacillus pantothenticus]